MDHESKVLGVDVSFDRDSFMQKMLRDLAGVLQDSIGVREARGFVSIVGARMGDALNDMYRKALGQSTLNGDQVVDVMIDLKHRIGGDFYVISQDSDQIVLGNRKCPFGANVEGRPAMCMMTSNVFGRIAAENLGYACVSVEESFANGNDHCLVRLTLDPNSPKKPLDNSREYFRIGETVADGKLDI
ncbi:MAG: methanogen output domain 1-containing protein [Alphaproteobacteria bacterium]|nr:methanogen output domain 1-containing protein [Alphaproteobacteria bacterium]